MPTERKHIPKLWKEKILNKQRNYCAGKDCAKLHHGKKMKVDMYSNFDHIRPLAMDGKNILSNIQGLCATCHQAKTRADRLRIKKWKEGKKPVRKKPRKKRPKSPFDIEIPKVDLPRY